MSTVSDTARAELELEQIRAHITRTLNESLKLSSERAKLDAEQGKLVAEERKFLTEARWYPFVVTAVAFGAGAAFAKVFLGAA